MANLSIRLHKTESLKDSKGRYPVVLLITHNRIPRRKRTGIWCKANQLSIDDDGNARFQEIHGRKEKQDKINTLLRQARRIIEDHFENVEFNYKKFCKLLDEKVDTKERKKVGVAEFCEQVSKEFLAKGQVRSSEDYRFLVNTILNISPNDLYWEDFNEEWLIKLEQSFVARGTNGAGHFRRLKALFGKAVQQRLVDFRNNPFKNPYTNPYGYDTSKLKKHRISKANPNRIKDLTKEQLLKLRDYEPISEKEAEYMDIWWFSFYCFGVNLTDLAYLQKKHIKGNRWYYTRSKSGVGLKSGKPLLPEAIEIIERRDTGDKYIFPILNNGYDDDILTASKRINDYAGYIRKAATRICKRLKMDGHFTFYSARHSAVTLAINSGADKHTASKLLDHSNFSTIDHYAGNVDDDKVIEAMEILRLKG